MPSASSVLLEFPKTFLSRLATHPVEKALSLALVRSQKVLDRALSLDESIRNQRDAVSQLLFDYIPRVEDNKVRSKLLALRRQIYTTFKPIPCDFNDMLTGMESSAVEALRAHAALLRRRERVCALWRKLFQREMRIVRKRLRELLVAPFVSEGIFLSSDSLMQEVRRYIREASPGGKKGPDNLEVSVVEHLSRSCFKTTPRGLLAAVALGRTMPENPSGIAVSWLRQEGVARRRTILALECVKELAHVISTGDPAWKYVLPRPNPTWRRVGGKICFWRMDKGEEVLCRLPENPLTMAFVTAAESRQKTARQIVEEVKARLGGRLAAVETAYKKLCGFGLLIGHLEIPFSENDGFAFLSRWVESLPARAVPSKVRAEIGFIRESLSRLDDPGWVFNPEKEALYRKIQSSVERIAPESKLPLSRLFVTDSVAACAEVRMGGKALDLAREALAILLNLPEDHLGAEPEDPVYARLAHALSISEPLPVLDCYEGVQARREPGLNSSSLGPGGARVLHPQEEGYGCFLFHVLAPAPEAVERGDFTLVCGTVWPSPFALSRWTLLFEACGETGGPLRRMLEEYRNLDSEEATASVLFQYGLHVDTAGWHPSFYPYEIELLGARSDFQPDRIIPLRELELSRSSSGRRVELLWRKNGDVKSVYPRLHSLVDSASDAMLRVFHSLHRATDHRRCEALGRYLWPGAIRERHLPRITAGRTVLRRESWRLSAAELPNIAGGMEPQDVQLESELWRRKERMPRFMFIRRHIHGTASHWSSPWFFDAHNPFHLRALQAELRKSQPDDWFIFQEALPGPDELWTKGPEGCYVHEIALPFQWRRRPNR